jgi:hypothetical protein
VVEQRQTYRDRDGVRRTLIWDDDAPGRVVVHTEEDVEPLLDSIARDREIMPNNGHNKLAARIPVTVAEDLIRRGIYHDESLFKAWLNSPEAAPFRIWQGRL